MAGFFTGTALLLLLLLFSLSTNATKYQTLIPSSHTLPQPNTNTLPLSSSSEEEEQLSLTENTLSLSLDLHHLDTLSLPANATPESLFNHRLSRDSARVKTITSLASNRTNTKADFSSSVISGLAQGSGEYFTRIGIGTPARYAYMVLDTGSDVVWIQCSPCRRCYTQSDPIFNPTKSKTFAGVACGTPLCNRLDSPGCNKKCMYQVSYGDGSFTVGEFSTETLTFRKTKVNNIAFGCGYDNEGLFVGAAGLLGLGRGKSMSAKPSSLVFGNAAVSRVARFTPLVSNPQLDTFYYVGLTGISVGGVRVPGISSSLFQLDNSGNGGVIIDSGTSVTRLTRPAYVALRNAFLSGASHLKRGPNFSLFDACFDLSGKTEVKVPTVVMHFKGADVSLPASNYLIPVDSNGSFCLAFAGTTSGLSIIGNIQQQGFRVVYDLAGSRVGFAPKGCA
ncbi:putative nepenthesin [Helianthus debilis subsp. tardiflorus]